MSVVQHLDSFVHSFILDSLSTIDTFHQGVDRFWDAEWESSFLGLLHKFGWFLKASSLAVRIRLSSLESAGYGDA